MKIEEIVIFLIRNDVLLELYKGLEETLALIGRGYIYS